ncbi:hypothetical protein B0H14DRAFT_2565112 [Mycena olivaceomarginata]|nr:hypothetical protein B0H14DRAFT_2565112 [Mycena olivaceomarginata]
MDTLFLKNAQADTSRKFLDILADPKLAVVIYETWWHCDFLQRAKEEIWCPKSSLALSGPTAATASTSAAASTSTAVFIFAQQRTEMESKGMGKEDAEGPSVCLLCKVLPKDEKCIQEYEPDDDEASKIYVPHYANLEALGFVWIKPCPETFERCGKNITQFVYQGQGIDQLVGGVRYHAMVPETLEQLISNHYMVVVHGIPGDVYGLYACHKGNTVDDIQALFHHALNVPDFATDIVIEPLKSQELLRDYLDDPCAAIEPLKIIGTPGGG